VLTQTHIIAGQIYAVAYQYVTYARDAQGRVTGVTTKKTAAATTTETLASGISWKPMSALLSGLTYGNGLVLSDTYTLDYEINRILLLNGAADVIDRSHQRTDLLNLTGITDAVTPANTQTFGYSPVNRLASATSTGSYGTYGWTYDGVGNRTGQTLTGTVNETQVCTVPATSNRTSQITVGPTITRAFTYDAIGNLTQDGRSGINYVYTYNRNNRLKTVTVAGNLRATYTYTASEQLAIRTLTNMTPSGTIHSLYDRDGNLLMESNGLTTGITREYIWLPETTIAPAMGATAPVDMPLAVVDAVNTATPATYFVHTDHLNRPARMTDASRAAVWQVVWKPFGEVQAITGAASLDARFPGQWFQIESGLAYNWHRHYDASLGRYTQADPLGFVDGPSVYGYAGGNSVASVDFSGLIIVKIGPDGKPIVTPEWENLKPGVIQPNRDFPEKKTMAKKDMCDLANKVCKARCFRRGPVGAFFCLTVLCPTLDVICRAGPESPSGFVPVSLPFGPLDRCGG
jgi:RHS repeat-associated protein